MTEAEIAVKMGEVGEAYVNRVIGLKLTRDERIAEAAGTIGGALAVLLADDMPIMQVHALVMGILSDMSRP